MSNNYYMRMIVDARHQDVLDRYRVKLEDIHIGQYRSGLKFLFRSYDGENLCGRKIVAKDWDQWQNLLYHIPCKIIEESGAWREIDIDDFVKLVNNTILSDQRMDIVSDENGYMDHNAFPFYAGEFS